MAGNLENVGFATPGKEGLYNILIMEEKQTIMALGAGTSCKYVSEGGATVTRSENVKDVKLYIERIDEMIDRKREKLEEMGWL
jgi:oxygen-independent coproporphyrinogen-3 oxidase